jgi:hypothetical protein
MFAAEEMSPLNDNLDLPFPDRQDIPSGQPSSIRRQPIPASIRQFFLSTFPRPQRLPFLRRNMRISFETIFLASQTNRNRSRYQLNQAHSEPLPSVNWRYKLQDEVSQGHSKWGVIQTSWLCQLCNGFPAFSHRSALLFHIHRDHSEFDVRLRRRRNGKWRLDVDLSPAPSIRSGSFSTIINTHD